jgi:hypothetical protein
MKEIKITKSFETPKGNTVTVEGRLELERDIWLDGDTMTQNCCNIYVDVIADNRSQGGNVRALTPAEKRNVPAEYNWVVGHLALTDAQAEIVKSVRRELEQHPAWQEKQARIAQNEKDIEEYERTNGRLIREMDREDSDF